MSSFARVGAKPPSFSFKPKEHFELGEALGPDGFRDGGETVRRAVRGAERARWRGWSARLAQFMLDLHTGEHGYTEVNPPILVRGRRDVRHGATAEV